MLAIGDLSIALAADGVTVQLRNARDGVVIVEGTPEAMAFLGTTLVGTCSAAFENRELEREMAKRRPGPPVRQEKAVDFWRQAVSEALKASDKG